MKNVLILFALMLSYVSSEVSAHSQDEKISALREAVGRGEQIFGGIMLAQKCKTFKKAEYDRYEAKSKAIIALVKKAVGQEKVNLMVQRAQMGIAHEDYSNCGDKTDEFVNASNAYVERTYSILSSKEH